MKRIISLILTVLLLMVNINIVVFAGTLTELTINATNIYNNVAGEGYYDEGSYTTQGFEITGGTTVVFRFGDWAAYDVSSLAAGRYKMSLNYAARLNVPLSVYVDDVLQLESSVIPTNTEAWGTYKNEELGIVEFSGTQKKLKVLNRSTNTYATAMITTFTFTKIDDLEVASVSGNASFDNDVFARGTDVFTITMNKNIEPTSYSDGDVVLKDELGNEISSDVSLSEATITIKLKETLDYEKEYTIYFSDDLEGTGNEKFAGEGFEYAFETADDSDQTGFATITVSSYETGNGTISASGRVESSCGLGIKGRNVELYVQHRDAMEANLAETVTTGENGVFEISHVIDENADGGKYFVEISSDYVSDIYNNTMLFFNEALEEEIKTDFSGLADVEAVKETVAFYEDFLDIDLEWAKDILDTDEDRDTDGLEDVYAEMVGKTFATANDAIKAFKHAVYFDVLVKTDDAEDIKKILDDPLKAAVIEEFNAPLWDALEDGRKDGVATEVLSLTPSDLDVLADGINEMVINELVEQFGLVASEISFSDSEVFAGEKAEIVLSLDKAIKDVLKMHFAVAYEEEAAPLFEGDGIEISVLGDMEYSYVAEGGTLTIELTSEKPVAISEGEFMTISIPTVNNAIGTHTLFVSGDITYHPEEISDLDDTFAIEFSSVNNPVITVNMIRSLTYSAFDIINRIEGDGFHDETQNTSGKPGVEQSGSGVVFRQGDWAKYDISALSAGNYQVSAQFATNANTTHVIEAEGKKLELTVEATSVNYETNGVVAYGLIELSGNQDNLKFLNKSSASIILREIYIIRVDAPKITEWSANAGISNSVVPRGTDHFTLTYNNELNAQSVTDESVLVKAKDGTAISSKVSVSGSVITIDLKETLNFNAEYEIAINAMDKYEQAISDTVVFKTAGTDETAGSSSIIVDKFRVNGNEFTAEGRVLSSGGVGIKGRTVKLSAKAPNGSVYEVWAEGVSADSGAFVLTYTFDAEAESGKYEAKIEYEYGMSAYEADAYYFDEELNATISDEFSNLSEVEFEAKLKEYAEQFGLDMTAMEENIDVTLIASNMANREYDKVADIIDEVNARYALERVNGAADADAVKSLIDDSDALDGIAEIQREKWDALSLETQIEIATEIKDGGRIEEPTDLTKKIDELINKALEEHYSFAAATVSVNSTEVNVGQNAAITFKASQRQENVAKIHIELAFTEDEAVLFEGNISYELSKDLKALKVIQTKEDGKLILDLIVEQNTEGVIKKTYFREDIITIIFKAETDMAGTYNPTISGYVTYHSDEAPQSEAYFADVPFEVTGNPTIKVNKINTDSKKDYSGGGGVKGVTGYGTEGTGAKADSIPQTITDSVGTSASFSDLGSALWAKEAVEALAAKGIINGRGDGTFAPNDIVTRAEFCKMITLAFNAVKADATCDFKDVSGNAWFHSYVASANAAGFINGRGDRTFAPNDTMSREEMVAVAFRALGKEAAQAEEKFADDDAISDYAKSAVYTLKKLGIIDGVGDNMFAPKALVTRAMAAKVIYALVTV